MTSNVRKDSAQTNTSETEISIQTPFKEPEDKYIKAEQLAIFRDKSCIILEKSEKIDRSISVKNMANSRIKQYMVDLTNYHARKERIYKITIGYWLVTIVLGLVAMTLERQITELVMFIIWVVLLASNILLVLGHHLYDQSRINTIIKKYAASKNTVTGNPVTCTVKVEDVL